MDPQQNNYYNESVQLCSKLINQLENDRDSAHLCFDGEMLRAYRRNTEIALQYVRNLKATLQNLQAMQK